MHCKDGAHPTAAIRVPHHTGRDGHPRGRPRRPPIEITPTPRACGSPSTRRSSRPASRGYGRGRRRAARGSPAASPPGTCPAIPAGARQAASSSAVAVGLSASSAAPFGGRVQAAGGERRRTAAAAGAQERLRSGGAAGRVRALSASTRTHAQGVWEAVSILLGGRHSRGCRACGRSFCTHLQAHAHAQGAPAQGQQRWPGV